MEASLKMQVSVALFRIVRKGCLRGINNMRTFSGGREFGGGSEPEVITQESTIRTKYGREENMIVSSIC